MAFFQNAKMRQCVEKTKDTNDNQLIMKKNSINADNELDKVMARKKTFYSGDPEYRFPYCFPQMCYCGRKTCTTIIDDKVESSGVPLNIYVYPHRLAREIALYQIKYNHTPTNDPGIWLLKAYKLGTLNVLPKKIIVYIAYLMRDSFDESVSNSWSGISSF